MDGEHEVPDLHLSFLLDCQMLYSTEHFRLIWRGHQVDFGAADHHRDIFDEHTVSREASLRSRVSSSRPHSNSSG